jgi:hypothetical protein
LEPVSELITEMPHDIEVEGQSPVRLTYATGLVPVDEPSARNALDGIDSFRAIPEDDYTTVTGLVQLGERCESHGASCLL